MVKTKSQKVLRTNSYFWRNYKGKTIQVVFLLPLYLYTHAE